MCIGIGRVSVFASFFMVGGAGACRNERNARRNHRYWRRAESDQPNVGLAIRAFRGQPRSAARQCLRSHQRGSELYGVAELSGCSDVHDARHQFQHHQPVGDFDSRHPMWTRLLRLSHHEHRTAHGPGARGSIERTAGTLYGRNTTAGLDQLRHRATDRYFRRRLAAWYVGGALGTTVGAHAWRVALALRSLSAPLAQ